jgi:tRNA G18 (ribose-2'-O)-methylase SpoU
VRPSVRAHCDLSTFIGSRRGIRGVDAATVSDSTSNEAHNVDSLNVSNALSIALFHLLGR